MHIMYSGIQVKSLHNKEEVQPVNGEAAQEFHGTCLRAEG
jgi:hypothetical protein